MAESARVRALVAGVAVVALALGGCTDPPSADPRTGDPSPVPVRTDREPIEQRFPDLGDFTEVHWVGWPLSNPQVLGPTDTAIQALVVLTEPERSAARDGFAWAAAPADFDAGLRDELRPYLPEPGDWRHSEEYESMVTTLQYQGRVYLDLASGTVYLSVSTQ